MLKTIFAGMVAAGVMLVAIDYSFSIPNVYVSYETRDCVKVENFPGIMFGNTDYSCENMPSKYNHIWAQ